MSKTYQTTMASILDNPAVRQMAMPVTVEQYHRLGEAGLISERTELLKGVILEKTNKSPNHSWLVQWLVEWLREKLPADLHARQEQPLTFSDSEPEPDVAVVSGIPDDYRQAHPASASLVIEVAVSSVAVDREKAQLYATAGVDQYVIILAEESIVEVYSGPTEEAYSKVTTLTEQQSLEFSCIAGKSLPLRDLFQ